MQHIFRIILTLALCGVAMPGAATEAERKPEKDDRWRPRGEVTRTQARQALRGDKKTDPAPVVQPAEKDPETNGVGAVVTSIRYDEERSNSLQSNDFVDENAFYTDIYSFYGWAGDRVQFAMRSNSFDTFLCLYGPTQFICDDDSGGNFNAFFDVILPEDGIYELWASSAFEFRTGSYVVELEVDNNAIFLGGNIPSTMRPDDVDPVSITVQNTGGATWTEDMQYRLRQINGPNFLTTDFIVIDNNAPVFPGESYTFHTNLRAPSQPGSYDIEFRMVEEGIEFFGSVGQATIVVEQPARDAIFTDLSIPTIVFPGETFPISVTAFNAGSQVWSNAQGYRLHTFNDSCNIFPDMINIAPNITVPPGQEYTFTAEITAPATIWTFFDDFEDPDLNWIAEGLWHQVDENSTWANWHSPNDSYYYGSESTGDYDVPAGVANSGRLTSPDIFLPAGEDAFLNFFSWENTEGTEGVDRRLVYIDDGNNLELIHESTLNSGAWEKIGPLDISDFAGQNINIVFEFDTVDEVDNNFAGWYIDDVSIVTTPCFVDFQMTQNNNGNFGDTLEIGVAIDESYQFEFGNNGGQSLGWLGGTLDGSAVAFTDGAGLCLSTVGSGENAAGWVAPERFIELVDFSTFQVRAVALTDQADMNAIPFWSMVYDNFNTNGFGNNYGGEAWVLDGPGGANGIGRPQGRSTFDFYGMPAAAFTPQWRNQIPGIKGAISAEADPHNDARLVWRVLDYSAGIGGEEDSGTICLPAIRIETHLLENVTSFGSLFADPITNANYAPFAFDQTPIFGAINDAEQRAEYILGNYEDRATLIPAKAPFDIPGLYPIEWLSNELLLTSSVIVLDENSSGVSPPDLVGVITDTATSELGAAHLSLIGAPGNMFRAGSPAKISEAGTDQIFAGFFYSHNETLNPLGDQSWLRPKVDLFNVPTINGTGTGSDQTNVLDAIVELMQKPTE